MRAHKYKMMVDGHVLAEYQFLAPLKQWQLDTVAREYAAPRMIDWKHIKFVKVLNGVKK